MHVNMLTPYLFLYFLLFKLFHSIGSENGTFVAVILWLFLLCQHQANHLSNIFQSFQLWTSFFFWQVIWWSWRGPKGAIPHFSFQRPLPFSVSIERHSPWQWNPPFEVGDWQINSCLEGRLDINRYVKLWLHFEVISIAHCSKTSRKWLKTKTSVLIYNN